MKYLFCSYSKFRAGPRRWIRNPPIWILFAFLTTLGVENQKIQ